MRDQNGGRYHLESHGIGCLNPTVTIGPVTFWPWLAGWVNHLVRHRGEWEIFLEEYPTDTAVDIGHLSPLLSPKYSSPRAAAAAIDQLAAVIQHGDLHTRSDFGA